MTNLIVPLLERALVYQRSIRVKETPRLVSFSLLYSSKINSRGLLVLRLIKFYNTDIQSFVPLRSVFSRHHLLWYRTAGQERAKMERKSENRLCQKWFSWEMDRYFLFSSQLYFFKERMCYSKIYLNSLNSTLSKIVISIVYVFF